MNNIDYVLDKLSKSKFRSSFHLNKKMKEYVYDKGLNVIRSHAYDFINTRLKNKLPNDGKQTPMKQVHPVFIAEHATATCCRGCIKKWYKIDEDNELTEKEIKYFVDIIMKWIEKEI
jgi:hypothetical protein